MKTIKLFIAIAMLSFFLGSCVNESEEVAPSNIEEFNVKHEEEGTKPIGPGKL